MHKTYRELERAVYKEVVRRKRLELIEPLDVIYPIDAETGNYYFTMNDMVPLPDLKHLMDHYSSSLLSNVLKADRNRASKLRLACHKGEPLSWATYLWIFSELYPFTYKKLEVHIDIYKALEAVKCSTRAI